MRKPMLRITVIFSISLVILGLNLAAGPIEGTASISGTVRDEKGSPFDGILVRLINTDRNVTVSVITQSGGLYAADSLFSGTYEVPLTFQNGLTRTTNTIELGGALTEATTITAGAYDMIFNLSGIGDSNL